MNFDFALILVFLVAICGAITLLDVVWLSKRRLAPGGAAVADPGEGAADAPNSGSLSTKTAQAQFTAPPVPAWIEYPRSFFPVLLVVLLLRSFLVEPFQIPSGSMEPTLEVGDFILVNKFAYGLRLPVTRTKFWEIGTPEKGDVMVFRYPVDPKLNYIKRVVGVPGDTVRYENKRLTINGVPLDYKVDAQTPYFQLLTEQSGNVSHAVKVQVGLPQRAREWKVPEGHFFVMGDNRDNSQDSRVWGAVSEDLIVGKAFAVWMHKPKWIPSFSRNGLIE